VADYWLVVAGEVSGDRLGAELVQVLLQQGFSAYGAGGSRMEAAGLQTLVPFADLGVSGIKDVVSRLFILRRHLQALRIALRDPSCRGLLCIDYPGFNLRLMREAERLQKPVYWVAPPQIWAWKPKRGKLFRRRNVAVFFPFEQVAYERHGAFVARVSHPLLQEIPVVTTKAFASNCWALLPGSRMQQALRNAHSLMQIGEYLCSQEPGSTCCFVVPDQRSEQELRAHGVRIPIHLASEGEVFWQSVRGAICPPGTASLELALRDIPCVVFSRVDWVSYLLGRIFLRVPHLALPNLLWAARVIPEHVGPALPFWPRQAKRLCIASELLMQVSIYEKTRSESLRTMLAGSALPSEFAQYIQHTSISKPSERML